MLASGIVCHIIGIVYYPNVNDRPSIVATLSYGYLLTFFIAPYKTDGYRSEYIQKLSFWKYFLQYFPSSISIETPLDHKKQYIFCSFPHGCCSFNHNLTMTDGVGMFTDIYNGDRRDLAATILFFIPILRELLMLLGCVDAGSYTANYNMKKGRSLLIFIGGEKEQLLTKPHEHKVFVNDRKGFIKLAIQYGAELVPTYCYGENELYNVSTVLFDIRLFLQKHLHIGIPICFGRYATLVPFRMPLRMEMGAPIQVTQKKKENITMEDIESLHTLFMSELERLFERTKEAHGVAKNVKLLVL
jgi:hypothetical protein